jgi:uncharacterized membrane protein
VLHEIQPTSYGERVSAKRGQPRRGLHERGGEEFARVLAFSDGLFAIAMTLLVVAIAVPVLEVGSDEGELLRALDDLVPNFISFFLSFAVIGRYWFAHHVLFALLRAVDSRLIALNMVYLGFVAFLPFPTALLGEYFDNPIAVAAYALTAAIVSGMEVVLLRHAYRAGLMRISLSPAAVRWGSTLSLSPVATFLISIPIAFVSTPLAVASWFMTIPFGAYMNRRRPRTAEQLGG